ncbi:MAG: hypothetical protein IID49_15460 [Proteobacteria bacterium]|nr:hypothetical protein [Pseudomonadota bacterium]MCH8953500.1 hypothetical protein [Pseudomonadota bacterium]
MTTKMTTLVLLGVLAFGGSGCIAVLAGTAGALIVDEGIVENDGKFDPLENTELGKQIYE